MATVAAAGVGLSTGDCDCVAALLSDGAGAAKSSWVGVGAGAAESFVLTKKQLNPCLNLELLLTPGLVQSLLWVGPEPFHRYLR